MPPFIEHNTPGIEKYLAVVNGKPLIRNIPRGSTLCIVSLPSRREVFSNRVNGSYTPSDLDPGKYAFTVQKYPLFNNPGRAWSVRGEFLVDVTEEEYQRLLFIRPRFAKGLATSTGYRWDCGIARCSEQFTSVIAAVQHEGEHLGVDFLHASPEEADEALIKAADGVEVKEPTPPSYSARNAAVTGIEESQP
jgi:hypothetical protein